MAKQLVDTGVEPSAASHSAGGILVGMGDGSVRNAAMPQSPAGPVPVPYPNLEAAAGVSAKGDGGYVVTSASHAANDTTNAVVPERLSQAVGRVSGDAERTLRLSDTSRNNI